MTDNLEDNGLVYYCRSCHSLYIICDPSMATDEWEGSYCGKCMSTDIGICLFDEWLEVERKREEKRREIEWKK